MTFNVLTRMKRSIIILSCFLSPLAYSEAYNSSPSNKGEVGLYIDDAYYWPKTDSIVPSEPIYDKHAREFIFLEDTVQRPDTIRMRIVEK